MFKKTTTATFLVLFLINTMYACRDYIDVKSITQTRAASDNTWYDFSKDTGLYYFVKFDENTKYPIYEQDPSSESNGQISITQAYSNGLRLSFKKDKTTDNNYVLWYANPRTSDPETCPITLINDYNNNKQYEIPNECLNYNKIELVSRYVGVIEMVAVLNDCIRQGFDHPSPICPRYVSGDYGSCENDNNCEDCQPWGCNKCKYGYYKMGLFQKCQSCQANYPGCKINGCQDWNGCTECGAVDDKTWNLVWSPECQDQICQ